MNNITVDGSYFNNSFGLGGPRPATAPASRRSRSRRIEQMQVNVAPYDVRQGNFVGAGVNTVTRSGTNQFTRLVLSPVPQRGTASAPRRAGSAVQPGHLHDHEHRRVGRRPDHQEQAVLLRQLRERRTTRGRCTTFARQPGRRAGRRQRRRACWPRTSTALSGFLERTSTTTPARSTTSATRRRPSAFLVKGDYNLNNANKVTLPLQPARLEHRRQLVSSSSSLGIGRRPARSQLPELPELELPRSSRTSGRASASGTRCSAAAWRTT